MPKSFCCSAACLLGPSRLRTRGRCECTDCSALHRVGASGLSRPALVRDVLTVTVAQPRLGDIDHSRSMFLTVIFRPFLHLNSKQEGENGFQCSRMWAARQPGTCRL